MLAMVACKDNEYQITPQPVEPTTAVTIEFSNDIMLAENDSAAEIIIHFDKTAFKEGTILLEVSTENGTPFISDPAVSEGFIELDVKIGYDSVFFSFNPINNKSVDENRIVTFKLMEPPDGFKLGLKTEMIITIEDDEPSSIPVSANFSVKEGSLYENLSAGIVIEINFSESVKEHGSIIIQLDDLSEDYLTTDPPANAEAKLILEIDNGVSSVSFHVIARNDELLKGHKAFQFEIQDTRGGVQKGDQLFFNLTLFDDELVNKPKSFHSIGGGWESKVTYEYDESGRIQTELIESWTPLYRSFTKTYHYAENGLIDRVEEFPGTYTQYIKEDGRIVESERISNNFKISYTIYEYDDSDNIGAANVFYYNSLSDKYILNDVYLYFSFLDGNLFKQLLYLSDENSEDGFALKSTHTYDNYLEKYNPFPMVKIIPGIESQRNLPTKYRIEENGVDSSYSLSYEFREDGLPVKRYVSGNSGTEITSYEYY
jgi:hypothetical protein